MPRRIRVRSQELHWDLSAEQRTGWRRSQLPVQRPRPLRFAPLPHGRAVTVSRTARSEGDRLSRSGVRVNSRRLGGAIALALVAACGAPDEEMGAACSGDVCRRVGDKCSFVEAFDSESLDPCVWRLQAGPVGGEGGASSCRRSTECTLQSRAMAVDPASNHVSIMADVGSASADGSFHLFFGLESGSELVGLGYIPEGRSDRQFLAACRKDSRRYSVPLAQRFSVGLEISDGQLWFVYSGPGGADSVREPGPDCLSARKGRYEVGLMFDSGTQVETLRVDER